MTDEGTKRDVICQECGAVLPSEDTPHNIRDCLERLKTRVVVLESEKAELRKWPES